MSEREHIRRSVTILGNQVDAISWDAAVGRIRHWADRRESRYVCLCNVHSVVTARFDADFRQALAEADTVAPDGMPVAWTMRSRGVLGQERIDGPGLMWKYAEQAALDGTPVFLYGATHSTLYSLMCKLHEAFPGLKVAGYYSPPFRPLTAEEEEDVVEMIAASGAAVVFVGIGCPRQEIWMAKMHKRIPAVLIGLGAAFDYHAGVIKRAPLWMQRAGLEWLHRLASEPRRLWRRYCVTNTLFLYHVLRESLFGETRKIAAHVGPRIESNVDAGVDSDVDSSVDSGRSLK